MKNEYLAKVLKIAGPRDYELEDDPALMGDEETGEQAVESTGFWDLVQNDSRLARRVSSLPDDIRDMFQDIPASREVDPSSEVPLSYLKAAKVIIKNIPKDLMSFEKETSFDAIRNGLNEIIESGNVQPMPQTPVAPVAEETWDNVAHFTPKFQKIAEARMKRNAIDIIQGPGSSDVNLKGPGNRYQGEEDFLKPMESNPLRLDALSEKNFNTLARRYQEACASGSNEQKDEVLQALKNWIDLRMKQKIAEARAKRKI